MECKFSGKEIDRAGRKFMDTDTILKDKKEFDRIMDVLSSWRFCHEEPLNDALRILKNTVRPNDKNAIFAKRLKRHVSIYNKLRRFPQMTLRNMQDIGGCRAILKSEKKLRKSVRDLKNCPEFQTASGRVRSKDYIKNPKPDGYRSYHLVGRFAGSNTKPRNVEIQLRTRLQHHWATALEIVDLFSGQALKSNQGNPDWERFFAQTSRQFAVMDDISSFLDLAQTDQFRLYGARVRKQKPLMQSCREVQKYMKKLKVIKKFEAFASSIDILDKQIQEYDKSSYILLKIDTLKKEVSTSVFKKGDTELASQEYIAAEKQAAHRDDYVIALVSTSKVGGVKEAYPNFFADSSDFLTRLTMIDRVPLP